ncbi:hypothetical protein JCM11672_20410 [Alkaliphilus crotonatoxidans]
MEDVLEVYRRPYDESCPVICMDEKPYQLLGENKESIPMKSGNVKLEYIRHGTCSIFIFTEPLKEWRTVSVLERRTKKDWARQIAELLEVHYPDVPKICLVMDNLNIHSIASLYETFPPVKASELPERLEIHYTPKHGSWLNIAEIQLSVMTAQCLDRRIPDMTSLSEELTAWKIVRNEASKDVKWQFTNLFHYTF